MPSFEELGLTKYTRSLMEKQTYHPIGRAFNVSDKDRLNNERLSHEAMQQHFKSLTANSGQQKRKYKGRPVVIKKIGKRIRLVKSK